MISNTQAPFILKKLRSLDHAGIKRLVLKLLKKQVNFVLHQRIRDEIAAEQAWRRLAAENEPAGDTGLQTPNTRP